MAVAFDAVATQTGSGSISWSHITGTLTNGIVVVGISYRPVGNDMTISGVTYDGVAMTLLSQANNAGGLVSQIWYLLNPASGTKTIAITAAGTSRSISAGSRTYSGVHQTTTFGTAATATGASAAPSVIVSSAAGELVIDHAAGAGADAFTVGSGQTSRYNVVTGGGGPPNQHARSAGSEEAGVASVTMDWSVAASLSWAAVGVSLKPVADATFVVSWIGDLE